jgi:hypothetical protein
LTLKQVGQYQVQMYCYFKMIFSCYSFLSDSKFILCKTTGVWHICLANYGQIIIKKILPWSSTTKLLSSTHLLLKYMYSKWVLDLAHPCCLLFVSFLSWTPTFANDISKYKRNMLHKCWKVIYNNISVMSGLAFVKQVNHLWFKPVSLYC